MKAFKVFAFGNGTHSLAVLSYRINTNSLVLVRHPKPSNIIMQNLEDTGP